MNAKKYYKIIIVLFILFLILSIIFIVLFIHNIDNKDANKVTQQIFQNASGDNSYNKVVTNIKLPPKKIPNSPLNIEYIRIFGATEVPLFMEYIGSNVAHGLQIDDNEVLDFIKNKYIEENIIPVLNNLWRTLEGERQAGEDLYAGAIEPKKEDVINFFLDKPTMKDKRFIEKGFGIKLNSSWKKKYIGCTSKDIGFLFVILRNTSSFALYELKIDYYNVKNKHYGKKFYISDKYNKEIFKLNWLSPQKNALKASEIDKTIKEKSFSRISVLRTGACCIWLLNAYKADADGLPDYYLTNVQILLEAEFTINNEVKKQKIRTPYGVNAARLHLPSAWVRDTRVSGWSGQ